MGDPAAAVPLTDDGVVVTPVLNPHTKSHWILWPFTSFTLFVIVAV